MKIRYWVLLLLLAGSCGATGQGTAFTYQGRLVNNGSPANGAYDFSFSLVDTGLGESDMVVGPITNCATPVSNGLFTVALDFGAGVFNGANYWLDISVRTNGGGAFSALSPRQPVLAAPYAIMAGSASNLLGTLPASQLSGALPPANLSGTYGNAVNFNNGGNSFAGDGSSLNNLNAAQLTGTVPNSSLPSSVAFLNSNQTFTAKQTFSQGIGIGSSNPWAFAIDAMADQAVARLMSTNAGYGSVLEMWNFSTNAYQYLGAINFNDQSYTWPGQIGYVAANPTNHNNDFMEFRVGGSIGLVLQADGRGMGAGNLIGGFYGNGVSPIQSGGNVIAGGGWGGGPNLVLSNTSGAFIGAGSAHQIGPNLNDSAIMGGYANTIQDWDSAIVGGGYNTIQLGGAVSLIGGGAYNTIGSTYSTIAGGANNIMPSGSDFSFVGGGVNNSIASIYSAIVGGLYNSIPANSTRSFIGGGYYNLAGTRYSVVVGGNNNVIQPGDSNGGSFIGGGTYNSILPYNLNSAIVGGYGNQISRFNSYSSIGGGYENFIDGFDFYYTNGFPTPSSIGGGYNNFILSGAAYATIGGGAVNAVSSNAFAATIGGGEDNMAGGNFSTVPGGFNNSANGYGSFAAGSYAQANHDGSFVLSDSDSVNFNSTLPNQFSGRFHGGVRFETFGAGVTLDGQPIFAGGTYANSSSFSNPANAFWGSGAGLTSLNASQLTSGTVPGAALSGSYSAALNFSNPANSFTGNGAGLTSLNASQLSSGTVPSAVLSGTYANALTLNNSGNSFTGSGAGLTGLNASQLTAGTLPGSVLAGTYSNALILVNAGNSFAGNGGALTALNASQLTSGTVPAGALSGTYSNALTFNNTNNVINGNGAGLTGLNASRLTSGTLPNAAFSGPYSNAVTLNNAGNSISGSGSGLTGLNAGQLTSGTVPGGVLSGTYSNALTLNNAGNSFSGSGAGLTGLNASQLTSGTVPTGGLSGLYSNAVTMTNTSNFFAGNGTGLTNVNAATLNGLASTAFAPAAGSASYIQNQSASPQTASLNISGSATAGSVSASTLTVSNATVGSFALTNGGSFKVAGAGLGTSTAAFVQVTSGANISGDQTMINNPLCNGDPFAILLITHNYNPGGSSITTLYNKHVGVYYNGAQWTIYNEDLSSMSTNIAFNVLVIKR